MLLEATFLPLKKVEKNKAQKMLTISMQPLLYFFVFPCYTLNHSLKTMKKKKKGQNKVEILLFVTSINISMA